MTKLKCQNFILFSIFQHPTWSSAQISRIYKKMFKGTVSVTSSDSLCKDGKCPIFNGTMKTLISTKICNIMSNSGLKTLSIFSLVLTSNKSAKITFAGKLQMKINSLKTKHTVHLIHNEFVLGFYLYLISQGYRCKSDSAFKGTFVNRGHCHLCMESHLKITV